MSLEIVDLGGEKPDALAKSFDRQAEDDEMRGFVRYPTLDPESIPDARGSVVQGVVHAAADLFRYLSTQVIRHDAEGSAIPWPPISN
jgi:hypothetical protein